MTIVVIVYPAHSCLLSVGCTAQISWCLSIHGEYEGGSKLVVESGRLSSTRVEYGCLNTPLEDSGGSGSLVLYFEKHLQKQTNNRLKFGPKQPLSCYACLI